MTNADIIAGLRNRDPRITKDFFYWDGPTVEEILEIRKRDPLKGRLLRIPVCGTCRRLLVAILWKVYGHSFDYEEEVSDFYFFLMTGDKLSRIKDPESLFGWLKLTAVHFFIDKSKRLSREVQDFEDIDSLTGEAALGIAPEPPVSIREQARRNVERILHEMPNAIYAKILELTELEGMSEAEASALLGKTPNALYSAKTRAREQFKQVALKLDLNFLENE